MGNKLTMRQETIAEWDPYHGLKSIRMVNVKPYTDLQYELIQQGAAFAAMSSEPVKASKTVMQWHKTLGHCGPDVIEQLKKKENITVVDDVKGPQTHECETCALSKSKEIMSRRPLSEPTITSYKRIHFDLIILDKGWEGSYCVAHCVDEYTKLHQVKILKSKTQPEILRALKHFIFHGERQYKICVITICSDEEPGIGNIIQNWAEGNSIKFK